MWIKKKNADGSNKQVQLYEGSYALIIGNSEYSEGWDRLSGVKSDIEAVSKVFEKHGFNVETEENLTSERFEQRIRKFINDYGYDRNNRLIIYYAGHGYTMPSIGDNRELGYIIPSDTPLPSKNERGFRQKAFSMIQVQSFARQIQAKHALFIFDSCFSGKLFTLRNAPKVTPFIYEKVDNPVRQFITAGNETQTVPDESVFRRAFVRGLEGEADRNNDGYIVGTELAEYLKEKVTNYSDRRQTPQYGTVNDIDLDRGDFVFTVTKNSEIIKKEFQGVALVIGNSEYSTSPLKNPVNDATAMKDIFQKLGFEVITGGMNATKKEMDLLIKNFAQKLKQKNGTGVFFFAGQGLVHNNINYLIPIDFPIENYKEREQKLPTEAIDIENILNAMSEATDKSKILIIDSSLDESLSYSKNSNTTSLAYLTRLPENTFVGYSTKIGTSGLDGDNDNSPFTKALKNKISTKNLSLNDLFRQVSSEVKNNTDTYKQSPWFFSNMDEIFYFVQ